MKTQKNLKMIMTPLTVFFTLSLGLCDINLVLAQEGIPLQFPQNSYCKDYVGSDNKYILNLKRGQILEVISSEDTDSFNPFLSVQVQKKEGRNLEIYTQQQNEHGIITAWYDIPNDGDYIVTVIPKSKGDQLSVRLCAGRS